MPLVACTVSTASESLGDATEALCTDPPCGPANPPPKNPPPPPPAHSVTITSDVLSSSIVLLLAGSKLSIDTTGRSPQVFGPVTTYTNPVWAQCSKDRNACTRDNPIPLRKQCLDDVNERCAGVPSSIRTAEIEHSYLTFSPLAKSHGASDVFFNLETMHHDGSIFSFDIDIDYIHADFGENVSAGFAGGAAWLHLGNIVSNSPTVIMSGDIPNFDFTNMSASVMLNELALTPDAQSVGFGTVSSTFDFDWNADNFPDFLVSAVVDVTKLAKDRVTKRINKAFDKDASRAALSKAFAAMVKDAVVRKSPAGYARLRSVATSGTSLVVAYDPK